MSFQQRDILLPAEGLVQILYLNVDNKKLTDKRFRDFVRNSIGLYLPDEDRKYLDGKIAERDAKANEENDG